MTAKVSKNEIRKNHWENIYKTKDVTQVFWYQSSPYKSVELIKEYLNIDSKVIDIGCGTSYLVDTLLEEGYSNISVLDISRNSLEILKNRIKSSKINFICSDILDFKSNEKFDIWHDRAVFHFLQNKEDKTKYFEILSDSLKDGGVCILSTFRVDGDVSCAGLDVVQYDAKIIQNILPKSLKLVSYEDYTHITPKDTEQKYIYFVLQKR
ncbi:class I SAM-dependent methyltransferase [Sulfurimonas sp.]|nr:class I SAM-dependent methyltransferase [Sulfurimonas sp.]